VYAVQCGTGDAALQLLLLAGVACVVGICVFVIVSFQWCGWSGAQWQMDGAAATAQARSWLYIGQARSGSTWVMNTLFSSGAVRGLKDWMEPLNQLHFREFRKYWGEWSGLKSNWSFVSARLEYFYFHLHPPDKPVGYKCACIPFRLFPREANMELS
jgi:hypothetical protein